MGKPTHVTTPAERIALIRSITGHAQGHEEHALAQVQRILNGATLDDLLATYLEPEGAS